MRLSTLILIGLLATIPCQSRAGEEFPKRKPGLWEVSIVNEGRAQATKHCIDEATDARLQQMTSQMGKDCKQEMHREGKAYAGTGECTIMNTKITSKTLFKGDFSSSYEGEVQATYDPPLFGKKESFTKISAKWLGACEAGQKPGDMILPDGKTMNIDVLKRMGQMQPPK